jgi:hypothetical protein
VFGEEKKKGSDDFDDDAILGIQQQYVEWSAKIATSTTIVTRLLAEEHVRRTQFDEIIYAEWSISYGALKIAIKLERGR